MTTQNPQILPATVAQIAETHQLGSFAHTYLPTTPTRTTALGTLIMILAAIPCILFWSLLRYGLLTTGITVILIASPFLIIILGSLLPASQHKRDNVYLFENGIIHTQRGKQTPLNWSQIAGCEMSQRSQGCRVRTKDGRRIFMKNLAEYEELTASINNAIHHGAE